MHIFQAVAKPQRCAFADDAIIADWAQAAVYFMRALSIMKGITETEFSHTEAYTKEQGIIPLYRMHLAIKNRPKEVTTAHANISALALPKALDTSPQAFNQRMKTDKFSSAELEAIAKVLDASYISSFTFLDGTKI